MSVQADAQGNLGGQIRVPFGLVSAGSREFVLTGDQGSVARMTVHFQEAEGGPTHERPFDQSVRPIGAQAIAQTFRLSESRMVRQVQVRFCAIGESTHPVWMQIRETQNGIPTDVILGERVLYPPRITPAVQGGWTSFQFDPPIPILVNIEYAIVLMTTDPGYTVEIGQLGQYVNAGDGPTPPYPGWITNQPYQVGVLQVSSDIDTWTAMQDTDLVFRIMGCVFTGSPRNVSLGNVTIDNATDAMVKAIVHRPFGVADAHFVVTHVPTGEVHSDLEGAAIRLQDRRSGVFSLTARLEGDSKASPVLFPNSRLELGNQIDTADYITIPIDAGDQFNLTMIFDAYRPPGSSISPFVAVQHFSGGIGIGPVSGVYDWTAITTQVSAISIGNGWTEETWRVTDILRGIQPDYTTRLKITLAGNPANRPLVKNLRAITILAS